MAHFKIEIDSRVLDATGWASFIPPIDTKFPRAYQISDGGGRVFFSTNFHMWLSKEQFGQIFIEVETTLESVPAPNVGFSEGFILRALAIAQDPKLAKELV